MDYRDESNNELRAIEFQIALCKRLQSRLKTQLRERARHIIVNAPDADEREVIASDIYWFHEDVSAEIIREAMPNMKRTQIADYVGPAHAGVRCQGCGEKFTIKVKSRSHWKEIQNAVRPNNKRWHLPILCEDCENKRTEEMEAREMRYEQQRQRQIQLLHELKTMPYADYLQTEHWQEKRRSALKSAHFRCQLCNTQDELHVHHRTYERRGEENMKDLIVLCKNCHAKFHDKLSEIG